MLVYFINYKISYHKYHNSEHTHNNSSIDNNFLE